MYRTIRKPPWISTSNDRPASRHRLEIGVFRRGLNFRPSIKLLTYFYRGVNGQILLLTGGSRVDRLEMSLSHKTMSPPKILINN